MWRGLFLLLVVTVAQAQPGVLEAFFAKPAATSAPGYSPTNNPDNATPAMWLRANDLSAGSVSTWTDATTNHWTSSTASSAPTCLAGRLGTNNTVSFNGSGNYLWWGQYSVAQPSEFVIVCSVTNLGANHYIVGPTNGTVFAFYQGTSFTLHCGSAAASGVTITNIYRAFRVMSAGAQSWLWTNNASVSASPLANVGTNARNGVSLGANGTPGFYGNIEVAEVLFYNSTNTVTAYSNLYSSYLRPKFGLQ